MGGRSLTAGVITGSLLLTNLSIEQIVGLNGAAYEIGLSVMVWETLAAVAMIITAIFFATKILKRWFNNSARVFSEKIRYNNKNINIGFVFIRLCGCFITRYFIFWVIGNKRNV